MAEVIELFEAGDKVKHPIFGQGLVQQRIGDSTNQKVIVKFGGDQGEKKLVVKYARLKKVNDRPVLVAEGEAPAAEPTA